MGRLVVAVVLALLIAVLAPRKRGLALLGFAALLPIAAAVVSLWFSPLPIAGTAAGALALSVLVLLLARAFPRPVLFLLLLVTLPVVSALAPMLPGDGLALSGALTVLLSAVLAFRADLGMRVACAFLGARVVALALTGEVPPWQRVAIAAALFAACTVLPDREGAPAAPPLRATARVAALLGSALAAALVAAWAYAPVLPSPGGAASARLAKLLAAAPAGGLLWALPSEAITWSEPHDPAVFPAFDNLDALWLGAERKPLWKLPGTTLLGRTALHPLVAKLREIKDPGEQAKLRAAARATVEGMAENLRLLRAGNTEAEIAAAVLASMKRRGCAPESFPLIVAAGASAAKPHGTGNGGTLQGADLAMLDIGCYVDHYASDFTRTLPVAGTFTARQRTLYAAVWEAQQAGVRACKPGARPTGGEGSINAAARAVFKARGLEDHNSFGIGHPVGLFVHDVSSRRELAEGMVITIEPGLYNEGELGIRIEDTYLVTATGCEQLTTGFPADPGSIERLMSAR